MTGHCWKGFREHIEEKHGGFWDNAAALAEYESRFGLIDMAAEYPASDATCMLEDGHDGDHDFISDSAIGLTFAAVGPRSTEAK